MNDLDTLILLVRRMRDYLHIDGVRDYGNRKAVMEMLSGCLGVKPLTVESWLIGRNIPHNTGFRLRTILTELSTFGE